jgi:hypothetical protein
VELTNRAWREEALARATEIETLSRWISDLRPGLRGVDDEKADKHLVTAIENHVQAVRSAAETGGPSMRIGARLGRVASNLHAAETDLLRRAPSSYVCGEVPSLEAHVRRHLPVDDPRRVRMEAIARKITDRSATDEGGNPGLEQEHRETIIAATRAASSAAEREQQRIRSFRTIVAVATLFLVLIAGLVALLGLLRPTLMPLCFTPQPSGPEPTAVVVCPSGQSPLDGRDVDDVIRETVDPWDVPLVEIVGAVAAGVTGAVALRRLRGSSTPFGVPVALTALKLPTGALTALLGLLLMRGGFVPGLTALDTTPQILAWAVVFGGSQQLFTGLVDRQAQNVLDSVGGKTYTATGGG